MLVEREIISLDWSDKSQIDSICLAIGDEYGFQHRKKMFHLQRKALKLYWCTQAILSSIVNRPPRIYSALAQASVIT